MAQRGRRPWRQSAQEYARGIVGGLFFSMPLLFTMEVWWAGFVLPPGRLLAGVCATLLLLIGYNRYAGLRRDARVLDTVIESVEELGLGIVVAAGSLWLLGRITLAMPIDEIIGKIVTEAVVVAIGVSIGTAELGAGSAAEQGMADERPPREQPWRALLDQLALASCGAVLVAANVAPTEEIPLLASEATPGRLLGMIALSIMLAMVVLFFSDFLGAKPASDVGWPHVLRWTAITYAAALLASAALLGFFGRFEQVGVGMIIGQTVVLGSVATLGASAGRMLLQ
ncbi:MAG TPA: TIGR02587 family membrane protein [Enhygromyxa sp.]|nr:TIGR02587 family membrane protein [Enhygromyxa sp.]